MELYIIRHGETDLNAKGILQGCLDEPLNQSGRELAVIAGQAMKGLHFDHCISSSMCRAKETAEIILRESGNDIPISIDDRIAEINFGDLEGKKLAEMGPAGQLFLIDPFHFLGFPNGESIQDLCDRTQAFLKELITRDDGKNYLISTHGCALRAMMNFLNDDPSDFWLGHVPYNCSVSIVAAKDGNPKLIAIDKVYYDQSLMVDHFKQQ